PRCSSWAGAGLPCALPAAAPWPAAVPPEAALLGPAERRAGAGAAAVVPPAARARVRSAAPEARPGAPTPPEAPILGEPAKARQADAPRALAGWAPAAGAGRRVETFAVGCAPPEREPEPKLPGAPGGRRGPPRA